MPKIASTAFDMIAGMTPVLRGDTYVFISTNNPVQIAALAPRSIATFKEEEGMSMLVTLQQAKNANFSTDQPMRCITLNVYSALDGIGLTAAVSTALAENSIPCNMVAAYNHDHVFVPSDLCDRAMQVLTALQKQTVKD